MTAIDQVDKRALYQNFDDGEERNRMRQDGRDRLALKLAHKSLDMADDEVEGMDIQANRTVNNSGMGLKEVALLLAMLSGTGLGGAGIMSFLNANKPAQPAVTAPQNVAAPSAAPDNDTLFNLEFVD